MMLTFRAGKVAALMLLLSLASACSREQQDWRSAEAADTIDGYGRFLDRHPDSELATEARTRVAQLSEDREWQRAGSADTADAYRKFLGQYPNGKWAQEARIRIQNFSLSAGSSQSNAAAADPAHSGDRATMTPAQEPRQQNELGRPWVSSAGEAAQTPTPSASAMSTHASITPPNALTAPLTGYAIQLGAFASESAANSQWKQLTARFSGDLRGLAPHLVAVSTADGRLFRLQARVTDEAHARALCDALRKQAQPCVPVLPR